MSATIIVIVAALIWLVVIGFLVGTGWKLANR